MTQLFFKNYIPITNFNSEDVIYRFKEFLVASASFVVVSSSNCTTRQAGDLITSGAVLANTNAYLILKQPLGATSSHGGWRREWGIQRSTSDSWRISYTVSSSHSDGGSATVMPSGSDRSWILETNSGWQAGGYSNAFIGSAIPSRFHFYVDNVAPYSFYLIGIPYSNGTSLVDPSCVILYDPLLSGTYASQDTDPTAHYCATYDTNGFVAQSSGIYGPVQTLSASLTMVPKGWMGKDNSGSFVGLQIPMPFYNVNTSNVGITSDAGMNCFGGNDSVMAFYYKPTTINPAIGGVKGLSSVLRIKLMSSMTNRVWNSGSSDSSLLSVREFYLPWSGSQGIL